MMARIDVLYDRQRTDLLSERAPYGRCAETYCIIGTVPQYFTNASMEEIRGIPLNVREIGQSDEFHDGFTSKALDAVGE